MQTGLSRVGEHNLPQEAPEAFAQAVVDVDGFAGWHDGPV
jgi:hypothetical protein